jgi:hypothetical protein
MKRGSQMLIGIALLLLGFIGCAGSGGGGVVAGPPLKLPAITLQPKDITVQAGNAYFFVVDGTDVNSWQWQKMTSTTSWTDLPGEVNGRYTPVPAATAQDNGTKFRAVAKNTVGSVTSNEATLTVTP